MALKDLSDLDFSFYKEYAKKMRNCHEKEFLEPCDPGLLRAMYRGKNKKELKNNSFYSSATLNTREHFLTMSRLFQGTNTILPNLYYQNPKIMALPIRRADPNSAALMTSVLNFYMKENQQKAENQEAVMNAWFFGIGWKKPGYRVTFSPKTQDPESTITNPNRFMQGVKSILGITPDSNESKERLEIVDHEGLFNSSESPLNIMLDHKSDLRNSKAILHRIPRTLYELKNFGNYDESTLEEIFEKCQYKSGSRLDDREIDLTLNELHIQQRNGIWILSWVDEHEKPLRYDPSTVEGNTVLDDFVPLVFTNEPGVRYPVSHMKVAAQIQENIDYLVTLLIRKIDGMRNTLLMNEKILAPGQKKAIEANKINGIAWTNKSFSAADVQQLNSSSVSNDLPYLIAALQQNSTEILGTDEQTIAGKSKNDTLGQDKLANIGTQIRESGMLDKVRDWMIKQANIEGRLIKQYSNAELHLQITGKDYSDKLSGRLQEDKWVSFMTPENPLGLKHYLNGEFDYDLNIYEALKPDKDNLRKQYLEAITVGSNPIVQDSLLQNNKKLRIDLLFESALKNFENIGDYEMFLETLDSMQVAAIQASKVLMQNGGQVPQAKIMKQEPDAAPQPVTGQS